jgi:hypothetical protein
MRAAVSEDMVPMHMYSSALSEIYRLRVALAMEARIMESATAYRTVPKTLVDKLKLAVTRCREAAKGNAKETYALYPSAVKKHALRLAGASDGLTRHEFERELRAIS